MAKCVVGTVDEIPPGSRKIVELGGRSLGIFNIAGEFFALRNRCPHQGGPLCEGELSGRVDSTRPGEYDYSQPSEIVRCPWHGWEFEVRTGQSWFDPGQTRVRRYPVVLASGAELGQSETASGFQRGPYVADMYPVSVEEEYIVVELH